MVVCGCREVLGEFYLLNKITVTELSRQNTACRRVYVSVTEIKIMYSYSAAVEGRRKIKLRISVSAAEGLCGETRQTASVTVPS